MNKILKLGQISFSGARFYLFITVAVSWSLFLIIDASGVEVIDIFLNTSYRHYLYLFLIMSGILIILPACLALFSALGTRLSFRRPPAWVRSTALIGIMIICPVSGAYFWNYKFHGFRSGPSAAQHLWTRLGPVLQFGPVTGHRAGGPGIVVWYFDPVEKSDPAEIRYGREPAAAGMKRVREAPCSDGKRHEFHLTGLMPRTRYYYQIPDWGEKKYSFISPPVENSTEPVRFTCFGDTGNTRKGGYTFSYYRDIMGVAKKFYEDRHLERSFVIHAGDAVRTGDDLNAWHQHFTSRDYSPLPLVATPGNHEFLNDHGSNFRYLYGQPDYYSMDYADAHILSIHPFDGPGTSLDGPVLSTGAEQYRFVKEDLAHVAGKKWIIVIIHIPMLSTGDYPSNEILTAQYFELFRKSRVDLVISGHNHNFGLFHVDRDEEWGGTIYLVAGTGGSKLDSYIMSRKKRRWKTWFKDPHSFFGFDRNDPYTRRYYEYGELSWGFTDVEIRGDRMTVSYYRWLDFERFLRITRQGKRSWSMVPIDERTWQLHDLSNTVLVKRVTKKATKGKLILRNYFPGDLPQGAPPNQAGRLP